MDRHAINKPFANASNTYAAIDLGSNSFHLLIAREQHGGLQIIDRLREHVRLADGLDAADRLSDTAMQLALQCLTRFGQRIRDLPARCVRAVGTNTLRRAHNAETFLLQARQALGYPIDVIAGREEARLIYLGVVHTHSPFAGKRLVVDIGGGSTELIIGQGSTPLERESIYIGCVGMTRRFFEQGKLNKSNFRRAKLHAIMELTPVLANFKRAGWDGAVGASGTIKAIAAVVQGMAWGDGGITAEAMQSLEAAMLTAGHLDKLNLVGLSPDRRAVLPGGYAVLAALFETLALRDLQVANGALREGLLHDLLGRSHQDDVRMRTISELEQRYHVDLAQAARVAATADALFSQVASAWGLDAEGDRELLQWAARVHEIGLLVAHAQYHRHAEYLLTHADMPGFSRQEQRALALLVRAHRRKFPRDAEASLPPGLWARLAHLAVLLRLAVLLHRSREQRELPTIKLRVKQDRLNMQFPKGWLAAHPLTEAQLQEESTFLKAAGIKLEFA